MAPTSSPCESLTPYPEILVQELLSRSAGRFPDKIAVIDGGHSFTYTQIKELSNRFASALAAAGLATGDRVGVYALNCVEFAFGLYGILRAGESASTVNSAYTERELALQINDGGASSCWSMKTCWRPPPARSCAGC